MSSFFEQISGHPKGVNIFNDTQKKELEDVKSAILRAKRYQNTQIKLPTSTSIAIINWLRDEGFEVSSNTEDIKTWYSSCEDDDSHRNALNNLLRIF